MTADLTQSEIWSPSRWIGILDRVEYANASVGLRFWGPPLWLEVTMSGPDSDAWSVAGADGVAPQSWNWNSDAPCPDVMELLEAGADDDRLLGAAVRYSVENLILNATHEIGEWLRFDGRRLFPAHNRTDEAQGNGGVYVQVTFNPDPATPAVAPVGTGPAHQRRMDRITATAGAWRFSYLPGTRLSYDSAGPLITDSSSTEAPITGRGAWSAATLSAAEGPAGDLVDLVAIDVHHLLVRHEADLVCRSFRVDGQRPWHLYRDGEHETANPSGDGDGHSQPLQVTITHM